MKEFHYHIGSLTSFRRYKLQFDKKGLIISISFCRYKETDPMGNLWDTGCAETALLDLEVYLPKYNNNREFPEKIKKALIRRSIAEKI